MALRVYLDTNVAAAAEGSLTSDREMIRASRELLRWVRRKRIVGIMSETTLAELEATADRRARRRAVRMALRAGVRIFRTDRPEWVTRIAEAYREGGAVPPGCYLDARHLAWATVAGADVFTSWNRRHLVRLRTRRQVAIINVELGHRPVDVLLPSEVIHEAEAGPR